MNLTEHFTLDEVQFSSSAVRNHIGNTVPFSLMNNVILQAKGMELVRAALGFALHIDSWYRCKALNVLLGGAEHSDHMEGLATDFVCWKFGSPLMIARQILASKIVFDKLIMEGTWVHISFNPLARGIVFTARFTRGQKTTYIEGLPNERADSRTA